MLKGLIDKLSKEKTINRGRSHPLSPPPPPSPPTAGSTESSSTHYLHTKIRIIYYYHHHLFLYLKKIKLLLFCGFLFFSSYFYSHLNQYTQKKSCLCS
ncbi:hypothetical protein L1887_34546 [Cichorium endivia]|nr:hypothetical protein L1887_34546 [Cichorium endivia]